MKGKQKKAEEWKAYSEMKNVLKNIQPFNKQLILFSFNFAVWKELKRLKYYI